MDYEHLLYEQDGPVTVITIDRPERMNAIGPAVARELLDAWTRFRADDAALVAVLTGAGEDAFCAGGDLKDAFAGEVVVPLERDERAAHVRGERPGILGPTRWTDLYKPTIAAVNGVAYAAGVGVLDRPVHRRRARDVRRDLPALEHRARRRRHAAAAADRRLPRGHGADRDRARDRRARGAGIGLVNEVVPRGTCRERACELAHRIAALPQPAIHTDKEAAVRGFGRPLDEGLRIEAECFDRLIDGPEMAEGLRRFNERDHPDRVRAGAPATPGLARPRSDG
jgi:enoyl-CoA hydratase